MKCQLLLLTHKERYDGFQSLVCTFSMFSGLVLVVGPDYMNNFSLVKALEAVIWLQLAQ